MSKSHHAPPRRPVTDLADRERPVAAMGSGPESALDHACFRRLCSELGAIDILQRLVELFGTQTPELLAAMRSAVDEARPGSVIEAAHKLKGSCLTLGAHHVAELCQELELLVGGGSRERATELVDRIETAYQQAHAALLAEVRSR
jgi:HPt (histidine-containing phosphotransfer) domain-containing protein